MKGNIFIKRPVMAISISVLILAIGLISLFTLPVEQYPDIAPPTVYVSASYTGADAEAVMNSVIMPLLPPLMQLIEALLPPVVSLLNAIMPLLSPLLAILEPIASVLGTIVGWVSKIVSFGSGVISKIAGLFGGGGGGSANVSGYATGGFTSGPSIAGEDPRYPTEAVISFNPAYRSQNLSYWAEAGRMLGASSEADYEPISSGSGTAVVYDLSGLSFSPQIKVEGDTDEDALIRKLRDLEPEFIDFVLEALSRREGGAYVTADSRLY